MKLPLTDKEKISKRKCQVKGCPNKAGALYKTKFLCEECNVKINPKAKDKKIKYVNYLAHLR